MKQLIVISLTGIFVYVVAVHSLLLSVLIQKTKLEVVDQLERKALPENTVTLSFSLERGKIVDPEFSAEEDLEFTYRGKMYDIVKQELKGDHITYYCLPDEQETHLRNLLTGLHFPDRRALPFDNLLHLIKSLTQDYSLSAFVFVVQEPAKSKGLTRLSLQFNDCPPASLYQPPEL